MNGLQRLLAAVRFEPADGPAAVPQLFGHAARLAGVPLRRYVSDGATLARCQLAALERYRHDALFALMDVGVESEAAGSHLRYFDERYPEVERYALAAADLARLPERALPDPRRAGRMPELLRAAALLRRAVGDEVAVIGCVLGPMTLATQLFGTEAALYLAMDDPAAFARLLDYATAVAIAFGVAQVEAGAHLPVVFEPAASPAVVPEEFFRDRVEPRLGRLFSALTAAGAAANWLHIAGPAAAILPRYAAIGVTIANFDYPVSAAEAQAALPHTCLDGNIKPLAFVTAPAAEIRREGEALRAAFAARGGFLLSSGCEIPPEARPENVAALVAAAR